MAKTSVPGAVGDEVGLAVLRLQGGGDEVVAQAEVQGELGVDVPVVLHEERRGPVPLVDHVDVRDLGVVDVAEQEVGHGVAGEAVAEAQGAARGRHVHVLVLHRRSSRSTPNLSAWLPRSQDSVFRNSNWFVRWNLGEEVRRADAAQARPAEEAVDGDARDAARDEGVCRARLARRRAGGGCCAERLLHRVRVGLRPGEAELVHDRRAQDARPARHQPVGLHDLVAEGRGARAVDDAAERAGDGRGCGSSRCSARRRVVVVGGRSSRPRKRSASSVTSAWRKKLFAPGLVGQRHQGEDGRAAAGSMRLAGMRLPGKGWPVSGSRTVPVKIAGRARRRWARG